MKLSIIIISWNCAAFIGECVDYVAASDLSFEYEIIVFDNASTDNSLDKLRAYDWVQTVASARNLGFGMANNASAETASGEYLLFLNPDAFVKNKDAIADMVARLDVDQSITTLGPRLLNSDGSHQIGDAGFAPTLGHIAAHQFFFSRFFSFIKADRISHQDHQLANALEVDWVAGTCLMIRKEAFVEIGGFSRKIFLYGEDVELGTRLRAAGKKIIYAGSITVTHLQGASQHSGQGLFVSTLWIDAMFANSVCSNAYPVWKQFVLKLVLFAGFFLRASLYGLVGLLPAREMAQEKASANCLYAKHVLTLRA